MGRARMAGSGTKVMVRTEYRACLEVLVSAILSLPPIGQATLTDSGESQWPPKSSIMTKSMLNTDQQIASIWQLGGLSKRDLAKRVWQQINEDNVLGRASELAYNFLLSIFPLLLFLLALFGLFASRGTELKSNLFFHLSQVLPPAAYQLVTKTITEVANNTGSGKLTFGLLFALWSASGGMTTMISVLDEAYGVRESRSWIKVHLVAIGLTIAISVL